MLLNKKNVLYWISQQASYVSLEMQRYLFPLKQKGQKWKCLSRNQKLSPWYWMKVIFLDLDL